MNRPREGAPVCAIYCRLSREDDAALESESIHNQRQLLLGYAAEQGWRVQDVYCDDDYSGADRERPEWRRMLRGAEAGRFEIILCKNQSRFTRDMEMVEKYLHGLFPLWGVRFVALLDHIDTAQVGGKKARQISGLVNEWYLEDLSENVRAVLDQKRRAGQFIGSFAPYGYRKDPADRGRLLVDEEAAAVVRRIFRMHLGGMGTHAIAERLNREEIPNPGAYKRVRGLGYRNGGGGGALWSAGTVSRILRGEVYTGTLVQGTKRKVSYKSKRLLATPREQWFRCEGAHEAVVDRETFDAVQRALRTRTRSDGHGRRHVLAGKVFCADCGAGMVKVSHTYKGERRSYLQCGRYAAGRGEKRCTRHSLRLDRLTAELEERMREHIGWLYTPGDLARFSAGVGAGCRQGALRGEREEANRRLEKTTAALRSLYLDKVEGVITREQFAEMNTSFTEEQTRLKRRLQQLDAELAAREREHTRAGAEARAREILSLEEAGRELYDLLVERVLIGEKGPDGAQPVAVEWRF